MLHFLGVSSQTLGTILIAYTALRVHRTVAQDKKIDDLIIKKMKSEQIIGIFGISLMILGFFLQIPSYL